MSWNRSADYHVQAQEERVRYRAKFLKFIAVVVVGVMLGVGSFSSTAHASPWNDYWKLVQLVKNGDINGMAVWAKQQAVKGYTDLLVGEVIRAAFEHTGHTCFNKPLALWWMPDSFWHLFTCARSAS